MFKYARALDPIDAAMTQAGRWFRVIGAVVDTGLKTLKSLTRGPKPGKIVADGSAKPPAAEVRRETREADIRQLVFEVIDREAVDSDHHEALVAALDARLSFNLAYVDIDILPLRARLTRLCADFRLAPDLRRWEASDFSWRGHHTEKPDGLALHTKPDAAKADRPLAHRPLPLILAVARLE